MTLLVVQPNLSLGHFCLSTRLASISGASHPFGCSPFGLLNESLLSEISSKCFLDVLTLTHLLTPSRGEDQQWTLAVPTRVLKLFRLTCAPATPKVHLTISEALLRGFISHLTSLVVTLQGYIFPARHPVLRSPRFLGRILPLGSQSPSLSFFNARVDFGLYCLTSLAEESCQDPRVSFKSD